MTDSQLAISDSRIQSLNLEDALAEARRHSLTRDNPSLADLPGWFQEFRDHQRIAVREILTAYEEGVKCVVLDAPTGSGKTLIGETVRRLLPGLPSGSGGSSSYQTSYICSSKALQDQFIHDYPYAKVLKGRSNYATEGYPERFGGRDGLSAADCTKTPGDAESCMWCLSVHNCPYERAKGDALRSSLAVLNTSYFLSECNGPGRFSRGGLVIADECLAAGTLISTPNGPRCIEDIQIGDVIWGEKDGQVVETTVDNTMVNEGSTISVAGLDITGNHPILTDRGYVPASQISPLDKIAMTGLNPSHGTNMRMVSYQVSGKDPEHSRWAKEVLQQKLFLPGQKNVPQNSASRYLRILPEGISKSEKGAAILQPTLRKQVELDCQSGEDAGDAGSITSGQKYSRIQSQVSGMVTESRQSDLRPCCPATSIRDAISAGVQSPEWRQWYRTHSTTGDVSGNARLVYGSSNSNRSGASLALQDRYRQPQIEARDRSRREQSPNSEDSGSRQAQDGISRGVGLGDSPSSKQEGFGEPGRGSGQDSDSRVYNLSTGTHNYIANGIIVHNCDTLESELMSHVEVRISERRLGQYGLGVPKYVTKEESWREWAEEAVDVVSNQRPRPNNDQLRSIREAKRHDILVQRLKDLRTGLAGGNWVYTGDRSSVAFKPAVVSGMGQSKLWQHGDKWLLMSATVISADELLESLGWDEEEEWRLVKVPSTFLPENRKVIVWPVASMTYKEKDTAHPKICEAVREIVGRHPGESVVVHSTSYELTGKIVESLRDSVCSLTECVWCSNSTPHPSSSLPVLPQIAMPFRPIISYLSAQDKEAAISKFKATPGAVLIGPSVDRGIDLPGDQCRVQIIVKVPFLNLQDKQVSTRLYGTGLAGKRWYAVSAIRTIVQMTGRAVRSEDDWAVAYVIDRQFVDNLWGGWKRLFPEWWRESVEWRMKGLN